MDDWGSGNSTLVLELESRINGLSDQVRELSGRVEQAESGAHEGRMILSKLVERMAAHALLDDEDQRYLVGLLGPTPQGASARETAARLAHHAVGKARCACGATVDLIKGVEQQQCPWCGATLKQRA